MHGRQLDRQGQAIYLFADSCHLALRIGSRWSYGLGSLAKERDGFFQGKGRKPELLLGAETQGGPARHKYG